jgi:pilus assembly protein CpaB
MTKRFVGVLIFAFVVASGASLLLYRLLAQSRPQSAKAAVATVRLALAARDLDVGVMLKEEDIKIVDWPGAVPDGAYTRVQDLLGRGVIARMMAREPILDVRLAAKGAGGGLASMIPEGMRAVAIRVNDVVGVAGFVTPGMRVDVLISGQPGATNASAALGVQSKTMLQNVEVLSAGQDYKKDSEGKPVMVQVVNLLVTPEQAEMLSLASTQTTIQLILRNPMDRQTSKTNGTAVALLFKGGNLPVDHEAAPKAASQPAPRVRTEAPVKRAEVIPVKHEPPFVMEIISGTHKQDVSFSSANADVKNNGTDKRAPEGKNGEAK